MTEPLPTAAPASSTPSPWRRRLLRAGLVLVAVALLWTLLIGWVLPRVLKPRVEAAGTEALGAPLRIEALEIAPWTLAVSLRGVQLGPAEAPWLRVGAAEAQVSLASVWHLAPVIRRLTLTAPSLTLERLTPERYNISPMLEALARKPADAPAKDEPPARFAVHNIRVEDGRLDLIDRVGASEQHIEGLRLGVPFLSNLPADLAVDVEPLLEARVNGSPLRLSGRTQPFSAGQRSAIELRWSGVDLAHWVAAVAPLLPSPPPATLKQGLLDLDLQVAFERRPAPAVPSLHLSGEARLAKVDAEAPAQGAALRWDTLTLAGLDLRPLERQAHIGRITLAAPQLTLDLPTLRAAPTTAQEPPSRAPAAASSASAASGGGTGQPPSNSDWQWRVGALALTDGQVRLNDPAWPEGMALRALQVRADGLNPAKDAAAGSFELSAEDAKGATVSAKGQLGVAAGEVKAALDLSGLRAADWAAPWRAALPLRLLGGEVGAKGDLSVDPGGWSLRDARLTLTKLSLAPTDASSRAATSAGKPSVDTAQPKAPTSTGTRKPARAPSPETAAPAADERLTLATAQVDGIELRARAKEPLSAQVARVRLEGLDLQAQRGPGGQLAWLPANDASGTGTAASTSTAKPAAKAGTAATPPATAPGPVWQLGELRCQACAVRVSDRAVSPAAAWALSRGDLLLRRLGSDPAQAIEFTLDALLGKDGRARLSGNVRPQPLALRSRIELDRVDLAPARPYLEPFLNLSLAAARTSVAGELSLDGTARESIASARWKGRWALLDLRALDSLNDADFLRFKSLALDGADLQWRPSGFEADLGQVTLSQFYGRVIVNSDGRINLRDIVRSQAQSGERSLTTASPAASPASSPSPLTPPPGAAATTPAPTGASAPAAATAPTPLRWRGIRLDGGQIDFTDNFIRPNYSARLTGIAGSVSGLAWNDPQPAEVKITGKVDDSAPLDISGTVHPLGARLQTDITASARGIDITRLSAYAARYAGYGIDKGTLSAKVHYRIDKGQLSAENQLYLDQLSFGDKVESPEATKLPVLLAVSLLKDRNGVIDINLPISGSLDDPQFSVGALIGRVIVNLIAKAVTAPFALLGQIFGGADQQLSHVAFTPGSAELGDAAKGTLDTLAKALVERPALKLEITGRADPASDGPALRAAHVEQLLRAAKARSTGEPIDDTRIEPAERARWLAQAYQRADLKTRPRNAVGLLKTLPDDEMEALLAASAEVGPPALRALADQRADQVKARLTDKVPSERLLVTASRLDAQGSDDKSAPAQASFALK